LKVDVDGTWKWLLLDASAGRTVEAEPVDVNPNRMYSLKSLVADIEDANPGRTRSVFIGVDGARGSPKPGAPWLPASETLRTSTEVEGHMPVYRGFQVKKPVYDPSLYGPPV